MLLPSVAMQPVKLLKLLILKIPRWLFLFGLPAMGLSALYDQGVGALIAWALATGFIWWGFFSDPFDGAILRFPLATYLRRQPPVLQKRDLRQGRDALP